MIWKYKIYLTFIIPSLIVLIVLFLLYVNKRRKLIKNFDTHLVSSFFNNFSNFKEILGFILLSIATVFILLSLASPKWGLKKQPIVKHGLDIVYVVDLSRSMLATDIKPNRLTATKNGIKILTKKLGNHRIGIVGFAGDAYIYCPLTIDIGATMDYIDIISPTDFPVPGTNIPKALLEANKLFNPKEHSYKVIILITDGENFGDISASKIVKNLKKSGVIIFTVQMGTLKGAPVPKIDKYGRIVGYEKDSQGKLILTKGNKELLVKISKITGGKYYTSKMDWINGIHNELEGLRKKLIKGGNYEILEERYYIFLLIAVVSIILFLLLDRKKGKISKFFSRIGILLFIIFLLPSCSFDKNYIDIARKGNKYYHDKDFQKALNMYNKALKNSPTNYKIKFNKGDAEFQLRKYKNAQDDFIFSSQSEKNEIKAKAFYNAGNAAFRNKDYNQALYYYYKALEYNPRLKKASYNIEYILRNNKKNKSKSKSNTNNKTPTATEYVKAR